MHKYTPENGQFKRKKIIQNRPTEKIKTGWRESSKTEQDLFKEDAEKEPRRTAID